MKHAAVRIAGGILFTAFLVGSAAHAASEAQSAGAGKSAPISGSDFQKASRLVQEVFGVDIAAAKTSEQKLALNLKLLQAARKEAEPAVRFALFMHARDAALSAGDLGATLATLEDMGNSYAVDELKLKADAAAAIFKSARATLPRESFTLRVDGLVVAAILAERLDIAKQMVDVEASAARMTSDRGLIKMASARAAQLKQADAASLEHQQASATLRQNPRDSHANQIAGKYACFFLGDWRRGLPLLAAASDSELKALATRELAGPVAPEAQLALADAWWGIAAQQGALMQRQVEAHAAEWYTKAAAGLKGLSRTKAERRLKSLAESSDEDYRPPYALRRPTPLVSSVVRAGGAPDNSPDGAKNANLGLYDQPPIEDAGAYYCSVRGQIMANRFRIATDAKVQRVIWYGLFHPEPAADQPSPSEFEISFYTDAGGVPSKEPVRTQKVLAPAQITAGRTKGLGTLNGSRIYEFQAALDEPLIIKAGQVTWISIAKAGSGPQWLWSNSAAGPKGSRASGSRSPGREKPWSAGSDDKQMAFRLR